ncbi:MAG: radical SAM protein [Caldisericales bacterium]|nr:radical SAM protein [Caldisericales bacterium]
MMLKSSIRRVMIQALQRSERVLRLYDLASPCHLCPRKCGVMRNKGEVGYCRAPMTVKISSTGPHPGEEPPISGTKGSGTIFFAYCTMSCKFCQNYPISQLHNGYEITVEKLSEIMLEQQNRGCHNVNLVTPSHYAPQIAEAIEMARNRGLSIPIVYNCSGYESVETIKLMDGLVDIYLPDAKYDSDNEALRNSGAVKYVENNRAALVEMYRQVGNLLMDENGIARKGLIIRHLVLPERRAGTEGVLEWIAKNMPDVHLSLMSQYFPAHRALSEPGLDRNITEDEYQEAIDCLEEVGITNGWTQPF